MNDLSKRTKNYDKYLEEDIKYFLRSKKVYKMYVEKVKILINSNFADKLLTVYKRGIKYIAIIKGLA